jgi:hypothetical protein
MIEGAERPVSILARPIASGVSLAPIREVLMARKVPVPEIPALPSRQSDRGAEAAGLGPRGWLGQSYRSKRSYPICWRPFGATERVTPMPRAAPASVACAAHCPKFEG